ncbi:hypothetical protein EDC96DRAFT_523277 [Choanephora cucurbitarum]|nr:hypothetical protein EDC96DRAFT_523277 [Choanephora cucurbitarum]
MSTSEKAQNDLKKLKSTYASELSTLKELFTDWTDDDLVFALQDADGDLELAIDRISEGHASQWGEVKTKKSKKEAAQAAQQQQPVVIPNNSTKSQEHRPTKSKQRLPQQKNWSSTKKQDDWSKSWSVEHKKPSPSKPHTDSTKTWASLLQ